MSFSRILKQSYFLPSPPLTEKNLSDQKGRVFIITGGYAGCGYELAKILYQHNGTVYIAGRSKTKADHATEKIKTLFSQSEGKLWVLMVDLADLQTIKPAVASFLKSESRLDVLTNNAGVMMPPIGSTSPQDHELQIATNCLGHYLLTKLLTPILKSTAALPDTPRGSVRVTWAASLGVDTYSPPGGVTLDADGAFVADEKSVDGNYGASKAGNYFLALQFAVHHPFATSGITSNAWNPGNLSTELQRNFNIAGKLASKLLLHSARFGGYTELWAGWAEEAGGEGKSGRYVWPWGRFGDVRGDVEAELGEGGKAEGFWEWCERETKGFA